MSSNEINAKYRISDTLWERLFPLLPDAIALGVLATVPSAPVFAAALAFVGIGRKGLALLHERTNQKFEIEEWVAFACPLAYINSFNALIERNVWMRSQQLLPGEEH